MKPINGLMIVLITANIYSQNVKVTDYEVPLSKAKTLRFDGTWNWAQSGDKVTANNAAANLVYRTFYSTLPLAWFINVDATGGQNYSSFEGKIKYNHNIKTDLSFRKYIWEKYDWFGFSRAYAEHLNTYKQIASDLTVGFGYGRYINATTLAKAVRIEGHLIRDKIISGYLPKETMINIANIIERENEYLDVYGDTYETYWFDDIEKEIKETDMLTASNVGALGILRMRQVLFGINERVNERYYGWDISGGILFPISTADKSTTGNPNLNISGRYSFPISWNLQVNSVAEFFTPMDSLFVKQYNARLGANFIFELNNRINFVASYRLGILKPYNEDKPINDHSFSSSFWYYLENNIYLTITGTYTKQGSKERIITSSIGLQYNLF